MYDDEWSEDDYVDDESDTILCPECGTDVYEEAEFCSSCGHFIVNDTSISGYVWKNRSVWWIVLGVLGVLAVTFFSL